MAALASNLLNVWAEIYDERWNVGGRGVPEILVKGAGDESTSALNCTANGHSVVIIAEVMGIIRCSGDMCNLENMYRNEWECASLLVLWLNPICMRFSAVIVKSGRWWHHPAPTWAVCDMSAWQPLASCLLSVTHSWTIIRHTASCTKTSLCNINHVRIKL